MDRRRTDRYKQMEMVLASIFLAHSVSQNTCSYRTQESTYPANNVNNLDSVNNTNRSDTALIGSSFCGNPVNGIPVSRTKEIISGHDLFFGLLLQAVDNLARGVLGYLERAELKERDIWLQQDLRLAQQVVAFAIEGSSDPYTFAFIKLYAIHPSKVVSWWRDRKKLLFLAEATNCPTPLLVAKRAEEVFRTMIPDYDYSQVSPVLPLPPRAHPANTPAPVRTTGAGDKEIL